MTAYMTASRAVVSSSSSPRTTIGRLKLVPHPEGGYYAVTWVETQQINSPFATEPPLQRSVASCIYYFLSPCIPRNVPCGADPIAAGMPPGWHPGIGVLHTNKSPTMHLLHHGVSRYTLIRAAQPWGPYDPQRQPYQLPEIREVTMGSDLDQGQSLQLLVEGGWWKVSQLPGLRADSSASERAEDSEEGSGGALISEVVTPGFEWSDHTYMRMEDLEALFPHNQELVDKFAPFIRQ